MKKLFQSSPSLSFILLNFLFTFTIWFIPVLIDVADDLFYALVLLGACGPLLAGYIITVVNSGERIRINSKPLFIGVFLFALLMQILSRVLITHSFRSRPGNFPPLEELGYLSVAIILLVIFIYSLNISNATNTKLKENYLKSVIPEKVNYKWYGFAFGFIIVLSLTSYFLGSAFGNIKITDYIFNTELSLTYLIAAFFGIMFFLGGSEEFGWRGFFQKELQKKYNLLVTSLIICFFWSLWHLPFYYNGFYSTEGFMASLPRYLWTFPLTITFTWLYNKSSFSLLAVILLHTLWNFKNFSIGNSYPALNILLWLFAVFCVIESKMWKKRRFDHIYENNDG